MRFNGKFCVMFLNKSFIDEFNQWYSKNYQEINSMMDKLDREFPRLSNIQNKNKALALYIRHKFNINDIQSILTDLVFKKTPLDLNSFIQPDIVGQQYYSWYSGDKNWAKWIREFLDPASKEYIAVLSGAIGCVSGETEIMLCDNTKEKIETMYDNKDKYIGKYVYSFDTINSKFTAGKILGIFNTGIKKTLTIGLENSFDKTITEVKCTLDHKFLTNDNVYCEAKDLKIGESIKSMYLRTHRGRYIIRNEKIPLHKCIANNYDNTNIHHINENKLDNSPDNLIALTSSEHHRIHACLRNKNKETLESKLRKLTFILMQEYNIQSDIDLQTLDLYRKQLIEKGYVIYNCPSFKNIDEFVESLKYVTYNLNKYLNIDYKSNTSIKEKLTKKKINEDNLIEKNKKRTINLSQDDLSKEALKLKTTNSKIIADSLHISLSKFHSCIREYWGNKLNFDEEIKSKLFVNHKVVFIKENGLEETYDLTIEKYHNYGIIDSSSVLGDKVGLFFTHNTGKSEVEKFILLFHIQWLCCLKNPQAYFGASMGTPLGAALIAPNKRIANTVILEPFIQTVKAINLFEEVKKQEDVDNYIGNRIPFCVRSENSIRLRNIYFQGNIMIFGASNNLHTIGTNLFSCFTKDTLIQLSNNELVKIGDLVGKQNFKVKSYDIEKKQFVEGNVKWVKLTRKKAKLIKITFEDGSYVKCTPDHKFLLKNGEYKEARLLTPEDDIQDNIII